MDTKELISRVRKIEIKTKGLSKQLFAGEYHSAFKGRGMSFSEVRDYAYGDNIKDIDWNVSARFGKPFVKIYEEERELTMMLLIDISQSSFIGSDIQLKNQMMAEIAAVLSFSALQNNDKVGLIFFSDRIEKYIPPKKGKSHVLRIIREMLSIQPKGSKTDIALALSHLSNVIKKRAIVFLLSDFRTKDYKSTLSIASRKHDLIGIRIRDKADHQLPKIGLIKMLDPETGKTQWVNTFSGRLKRKYEDMDKAYGDYFEESFIKTGTDKVTIDAHDSYVMSLVRFFKKRGR